METMMGEVRVMYVASPNGPQGAGKAFDRLEEAIERRLAGRKFYGVIAGGEYRAAMTLQDDAEPERLGFPTMTIPGGKYYREKIADWEKHIADIGPTFKAMMAKTDIDESRPFIEYYRSQAELFLLVPVR